MPVVRMRRAATAPRGSRHPLAGRGWRQACPKNTGNRAAGRCWEGFCRKAAAAAVWQSRSVRRRVRPQRAAARHAGKLALSRPTLQGAAGQRAFVCPLRCMDNMQEPSPRLGRNRPGLPGGQKRAAHPCDKPPVRPGWPAARPGQRAAQTSRCCITEKGVTMCIVTP